MAEVVIASRFRGPVDSANGGYACGVVGIAAGAPAAEVTLRVPPPLDRPLTLIGRDGLMLLEDRGTRVAEGRPLPGIELEPEASVSPEEARAGYEASPLHRHTPYPECFVCGPDRGADGLHVTAGPVPGRRVVAAPWTVDESLAAAGDGVDPLMVWSVLDCPSGIAAMFLEETTGPAVLGRMAAQVLAVPKGGESCVAIGWVIDRDGRKLHAGSALYGESGDLLGVARTTWIELRPQGR